MRLMEWLRKGLSFLLMSMGVSSPAAKKQEPKAVSKSNP